MRRREELRNKNNAAGLIGWCRRAKASVGRAEMERNTWRICGKQRLFLSETEADYILLVSNAL